MELTLQTKGFQPLVAVPVGVGRARVSIAKMGRSPKNQAVRTGLLQPQNFAWNSGPDDSKAG
jgi:hypothetical protein